MSTDRLKIYNGALLIAGERQIASLTVNEESRRLLDNVWDDGGVRFCLEQAQWRFAMRASEFTYDTAIEPAFGLARGFAKPDDWVETSAVCQDAYFRVPCLNYADENGIWYADLDTLYIKYVSDDASYGMDFSKWPYTFTEYVKAYFAWKIAPKLTGGKDIAERLWSTANPKRGVLPQALLTAKNRDAMAGPTTFPAKGTWVRSRWGGRSNGSWDGGNPNSLYG